MGHAWSGCKSNSPEQSTKQISLYTLEVTLKSNKSWIMVRTCRGKENRQLRRTIPERHSSPEGYNPKFGGF